MAEKKAKRNFNIKRFIDFKNSLSGPDKAVINQLLSQLGYFSKDASGPLGIEERLNIASYNVHVLKQIITELIKE